MSDVLLSTKDENPYILALMRLIDKQFTKRPFYGVLRTAASFRAMGSEKLARARIRRLFPLEQRENRLAAIIEELAHE